MNRRQFLKGLGTLVIAAGLPTIELGGTEVFVEATVPRTAGALTSNEFVRLLDMRLKEVADKYYDDMPKLTELF